MAKSTTATKTTVRDAATNSATPPAPESKGTLQKYLDKAVKVLDQFNVSEKDDTNNQVWRIPKGRPNTHMFK
jgi:hypothetical protein